jgi:hypothetical protein
MNRQLFKDSIGWGFILWLIGYLLGILFFMIVPAALIGWVIMPIGIAVILWVLLKKIKSNTLQYYFKIAIIWTLIAVVLDYFLLVKIFKPEDGYYKLDVYLYYALTFILPMTVGWRKTTSKENNK